MYGGLARVDVHRVDLVRAGRFHFYRAHNTKKTSCTSPAERPRARRDSDGTGLCSPIMHAALAAMRPIEVRVGLHEDGCRAVLVSAMRTTDHFVGAPQHERLIAALPNSLAALSGRSGVQLAIGLTMPMCRSSGGAAEVHCRRAPSTPTCC